MQTFSPVINILIAVKLCFLMQATNLTSSSALHNLMLTWNNNTILLFVTDNFYDTDLYLLIVIHYVTKQHLGISSLNSLLYTLCA